MLLVFDKYFNIKLTVIGITLRQQNFLTASHYRQQYENYRMNKLQLQISFYCTKMQSTYPYKVYNTASPITHHQLLQPLPLLQIYYNKQNRKCDGTELDRPDGTFHLTDKRDWTDRRRHTIRQPDAYIYGKFWVYRQNNGRTDNPCDIIS